MRTAKIEIEGREYLLCFSARVVRAVTERYGGVEAIDGALSGSEAVWLLATMMDGGARYAKLNDIDNPPALTADELLDVLDISDFGRLKDKIAETITNGKSVNVEAEPPKNAKPTQADP